VSFVVDSSVALSWCFEDERTPATKALLERVGEVGAVVPQHWPAEVLNGLMMAERRQRIDADRRRQLAGFLHDLPLAIDPETTIQLWGATQGLAERFRLTVYDAIYLELAHRKRLALASLDRDLCGAATTVGVPVLGTTAA
jgi:predicted nucleic acid-binding protein